MNNIILSHLTLNTGNIVRTSRADASIETIDALLPIIDAGGGPIPGVDGWFLSVSRPQGATRDTARNGAAFFQISTDPGLSVSPAIICVASWQEDMAGSSWWMLTQSYIGMKSALKRQNIWRAPPTDTPATLPWLGVYLTPFATVADHETIKRFGDLERCVAWALMV